jgi:hypothetical protein
LALREMGRGDTGAQKDLLDYLKHVADTMYPLAPTALPSPSEP